MKRYVRRGFAVITAASIALFIVQKAKTPKALGFNTSLTPGAGEILLINHPNRSELIAAVETKKGVFAANELPNGFYYTEYIPGAVIEMGYTKGFYLNADNIDNLSKPIKTEINQSGAYRLYKAKRGYENQIRTLTLSYQFAWPKIKVECSNKIGASNSFSGCYKNEISHHLFDRACIISHKVFDGKHYRLEFRGYKTLNRSIKYYAFDDSINALTDENLSSFLKQGDTIEFRITVITERHYKQGEAELMKMVDSIKLKV